MKKLFIEYVTQRNIIRGAYIILFAIFVMASNAILSHNVPITSLEIELRKIIKQEEFQFFFDIGNEINETDSEKILVSYHDNMNGAISFNLPFFCTIRKIRLDPMTGPGEEIIKSISLKFLVFSIHTWNSRDIIRDFKSNQALDQFVEKDGLVYIKSTKLDPQLSFNDFGKIYRMMPLSYRVMIKLSLIFFTFMICFGAGFFIHWIIINNKAVNVINSSFAVLFFIMIALPMTNMGFHFIKELVNPEFRTLAIKPNFEVKKIQYFFRKYENYFLDNFSMRNHLILCNSLLKYHFLGISPVSYVVVGKSGWSFFYSEKYSAKMNSFKDWMGLSPYSQEELEKIKVNLEYQRNYLREKGIPYLVLIAPNKETIYPEYLPDNFKRVLPVTRLDQLVEYMKKNSDVEIIDVRNDLINAKSKFPLFYKLDTHWNGYGALIAYFKLKRYISNLFPSIKPDSIDNYQIVSLENKTFIPDLSRLMLLPGYQFEKEVFLQPVKSSVHEERSKIKNAIFFHDSFGELLVDYLKNDIKEIHELRVLGGFDTSIIEKKRPSLVILEFVERAQSMVLLNNPKSQLSK